MKEIEGDGAEVMASAWKNAKRWVIHPQTHQGPERPIAACMEWEGNNRSDRIIYNAIPARPFLTRARAARDNGVVPIRIYVVDDDLQDSSYFAWLKACFRLCNGPLAGEYVFMIPRSVLKAAKLYVRREGMLFDGTTFIAPVFGAKGVEKRRIETLEEDSASVRAQQKLCKSLVGFGYDNPKYLLDRKRPPLYVLEQFNAGFDPQRRVDDLFIDQEALVTQFRCHVERVFPDLNKSLC